MKASSGRSNHTVKNKRERGGGGEGEKRIKRSAK